VFLVFGFSATFSLLEALLGNLTPLKIRQIKLRSETSATKLLDAWINEKEKIEDALIFCNSFLLVMGCLYIYRLLPFDDHEIKAFSLSFVITILFVLCCKVIPRTLAKRISSDVVVGFLRPFRPLFLSLLPLIVVIEYLGGIVSKLFPTHRAETNPQITEEDLEFLIQVGEEEGVLADEKHEMLSGVFELADTRAREIMVRWDEIKSVSIDAKLTDFLDLCRVTGFSRIPVFEGRADKIVGYIHTKDVLAVVVEDRNCLDKPLRELFFRLRRQMLFCPDSKPVDKLFQEMRRQKSHLALVLDEYGSSTGMVTMEDILEEIVGEVRDEFDQEEDTVRAGERLGEFIVESKIHLEDFCDLFHLDAKVRADLERESVVDTLAGLLLHRFGRIPKIGEKMNVGNLDLEILEVSKRRVRKVMVRIHSEKPANQEQSVLGSSDPT
jgi:putative hemolysin